MGNCQKQENQQSIIQSGNGPVISLRITNCIWSKDYQGLFDYDTKSIQKNSCVVKGNGFVIKKKNKFEFQTHMSQQSSEALNNSLFKIMVKPNHYEIHPIFVQGQSCMLQKILWLVVASLPNKQHNIQQKDVIKLGKQKIRVRQIVMPNMNVSSVIQNVKLSKNVYQDLTIKQQKNNLPKSQLMVEQQPIQTKSAATNSEQVCRICLEPGQYDNPLITPCKCAGSVKYIHLNCLKTWLAKRLSVIKTQHCITINWLPLSCQMCKTPFKYRIYMDNKRFYTVDIPKPPKPYITLELIRKQSNIKGKVFHFVSFAEKKKINLGRRKDTDVKISQDISISRVHAAIQYNQVQNKFVLTDNKSKFGTLVLIKKGLISRPKYPGLSIQVGAQVFTFDPLRGPDNINFKPQQGQADEYFIDDQLEDDQESQQQSDGAESIEDVPVNQNQLQEQRSPQFPNRQSIQSQPNRPQQ